MEGKIRPFIQAAFGKQRRMLETEVVNPLIEGGTSAGVANFCDPLFGIKGGIHIHLSPKWMLAPSVGVAFNLDEMDRTSLFADLELNYTFNNGGYIGPGISLWDFNHSDNTTLALLFGFGIPMGSSGGRPNHFFIGEGRWFFDEFDDVENNYQFWLGYRYVFGR